MNINIQSVRFRPSETLDAKITERLMKAFGKYPFITNCKVYLKVDEDSVANPAKTLEIYLHANNAELFAKTTSPTFEKALPETLSKLKRQVEKYKQKVYAKP